MKKIVIKNAYILDMVNKKYELENKYPQGDVVIEGNKIASITTSTQKYNLDEYDVIDASEMVVMPGLVNGHTHAAMTLFRGYADDLPLMEWLENKIWPLEDKLQPEYVYWGTKLAILEMLKGGTTCFADMYFMMEDIAQAVEETGIRACLSRGLIYFNNGDKALTESVDFIQKHHLSAEGRITAMLGPHAPYTCTPEYLREISDEAKKLNVGIHIHLAETLSEIKQIQEQYNKTPVEMVYDAGIFSINPVAAAHCVHMTDQDLEVLARENISVVHNPESNMKLASGIAPITKMLEMGINVGVGTDGAASNNNLDMFQELKSAALLQKVNNYDPTALAAYQALSMATKNGAKALGLAREIGKIQVGMKADLILIDLSKPHLQPLHDLSAHLVYSAGASDVDTVIINGQVIMRNRVVTTIDEEKVLYEVNNIIKKLI